MNLGNKIRDLRTWQFYVLEFVLLGLLFIAACTLGHCADTTSSHKNSLGVVTQSYDNNTTLIGYISGGAMTQDQDGRKAVIVRFHPKYMPVLFDDFVLLCGDVSDALVRGPHQKIITGTLAITYRTAASRLIDGVACHQLVGVDMVEDKVDVQ